MGRPIARFNLLIEPPRGLVLAVSPHLASELRNVAPCNISFYSIICLRW